MTQYDNVSFCNSSVNVSAAKWVISSEQNSIEAEEDTLRMQFPNADDVYNNISLSLTWYFCRSKDESLGSGYV